MQYILDQAEYDEYMELKTMKEYPLEKPDELMHLLVSGRAQWDVRELMLPSLPAKYKHEVTIRVDLEDLPDEAKDLVMSRVRRY